MARNSHQSAFSQEFPSHSLTTLLKGPLEINLITQEKYVDKMKVPAARILTWPWLASSLHLCEQYVVMDCI